MTLLNEKLYNKFEVVKFNEIKQLCLLPVRFHLISIYAKFSVYKFEKLLLKCFIQRLSCF